MTVDEFRNVVYIQMVSIYGQPEQCSEACREILTIMQREAVNANRGSAAWRIYFYSIYFYSSIYSSLSVG